MQGTGRARAQRRRGGASNFEDLETYEAFSPLRTKGPAGGSYVYLDDSAGVGTWVYRILDCDTQGTRSAVCQKLVEIDSAAEQTQTLVVGGLIATLALGLVQQRLQGLAQVGAQPRDARVGPARGVGERRRALALQNLGLDLAQRRRELRAAVREVAEGGRGARLCWGVGHPSCILGVRRAARVSVLSNGVFFAAAA